MSTITINNIETDLANQLVAQATRHGRSVEEEARTILRKALQPAIAPPPNLTESIHARFARLGGFDISLPVREPLREPPDLR